MIITKKHLDRRTFLRGLTGVTVGLPLLDAMIPALGAQNTAAAKPPLRFVGIYTPHGVGDAGLGHWVPTTPGTNYEMSQQLKPLEAFRDKFTIFNNLTTNNGKQAGSGHAAASSTFLSCGLIYDTNGEDIHGAETIDQMIAKKIGQETPIPSLELGIEDISHLVGTCDATSSCHYLNTMSWSDDTTPLPAEIDPRGVFERMFGEGKSAAVRYERLRTDRSLLDSITEAATGLRSKVGAQDKGRINDYLDNLREIERRIGQVEKRNTGELLASPEAPIEVPELYPDHVNLMFDLMIVAMQADITRVSTFMMSRELNQRAYPHIGVPESHHTVSHHQNNPVLIQKLEQIATYHVQLLSGFIDKLSKVQDGDATLLDRIMILHGSGMGNPNVHSHDPIAPLLLGGGNGRLKGGRYINLPPHTSMGNLLLSLLEVADIHRDSLGDSNGRVSLA